MQQWVREETQPRPKRLKALAQILGVNEAWLATGQDTKGIAEPQANYEAEGLNIARRIPIIDWEEVASPPAINDELLADRETVIVGLSPKISADAFALRMQGDSMASLRGPAVPNGSVIIANPSSTAQHGQLVLVKLSTNDIVFRQLQKEGTQSTLSPLNPSYNPLPFSDTEGEIIAVVTLAIQDMTF